MGIDDVGQRVLNRACKGSGIRLIAQREFKVHDLVFVVVEPEPQRFTGFHRPVDVLQPNEDGPRFCACYNLDAQCHRAGDGGFGHGQGKVLTKLVRARKGKLGATRHDGQRT
jgi:hypothetical protein